MKQVSLKQWFVDTFILGLFMSIWKYTGFPDIQTIREFPYNLIVGSIEDTLIAELTLLVLSVLSAYYLFYILYTLVVSIGLKHRIPNPKNSDHNRANVLRV